MGEIALRERMRRETTLEREIRGDGVILEREREREEREGGRKRIMPMAMCTET